MRVSDLARVMAAVVVFVLAGVGLVGLVAVVLGTLG